MFTLAAYFVIAFQPRPSVRPKAAPLSLTRPVVDKNFYFLSLIHRDSEVEKLLEQDPDLSALTNDRREALEKAFQNTGVSGVAALADVAVTDDQIARVRTELASLCDRSSVFKKFVATKLRESGAYQRYASKEDRGLVADAWSDCARGLNFVLTTYGSQTTSARSREIDSPLYNLKNPLFPLLAHTVIGVVLDDPSKLKLFFDPNLELDAHLLDAQLRDEAGRHEPMEKGVNLAAVQQIKKTNFSSYPYSVILVPGEGPEEANVALSPAGKLRIELAARRFFAKRAPFIIVSGGYVHPNMTPYSEAIEMKKSLIQDFKVPESAIIVDPHARHTTTNLRNASRLIYRYGIPFDRPGLIVSDPYQSAYIDSAALVARNQSVFGYQPVGNYKRLSLYDVEFTPNLISLSMDPYDPLDP